MPILILPLLVSCLPDSIVVSGDAVPPGTLTAVLNDASAPQVDYTGNDAVSLFALAGRPERYIYQEDESKFIRFSDTREYDEYWDNCYVISPFSGTYSVRSEGVFEVAIPQEQAYQASGPDLAANILIGVTDSPSSGEVKMYAAVGYLKLNVCGIPKIRSAVLRGNGGEVLSGTVLLSAEYGKIPSVSVQDTLTSVKVDCEDYILVPPQGIDLWFCLPPLTLKEGLTITIDSSSGTYSYDVNTPVTISRGRITELERFGNGTAFLSFGLRGTDGKVYPSLDVLGPEVTVCVPYGTDMTKLTPVFTHNGSSIWQDSKAAVSGETILDFTTDHTYRISSSEGRSATYTVHAIDYNLPVVYVSTPKHETIADKVNWHSESTFIIQDTDGKITDYGSASIKGRGNASWRRPKKSYGIKLEVKPVEQGVLGMAGHKRWCMIAVQWGYFGNNVGYELARRAESCKWQPRGRYVEFVLNGVHLGTYFIAEQIRVDKNRVNIKSLDPDEISEEKISGGYLLTYDHTFDDPNRFRSKYFNMPVMIKDPDEDDLVQEQFDWIQNYINTLEESIQDDDRLAKHEYMDYLDIDSYIDVWFVWETAGKTGSYEGADFAAPASVWFYKDRGGKLTAGPCWDFDSYLFSSQKLYCTKGQYYGRLFKDPVFVARVKEKWPAFRAAVEGTDGHRIPITEFVDSCYNAVKYSADRNQKMWDWTMFQIDSEYETIRTGLPAKLQWMEDQIHNF